VGAGASRRAGARVRPRSAPRGVREALTIIGVCARARRAPWER
jgi:hypothetical protein